MHRVLIEIPLFGRQLPIYGYGLMLFVAFLAALALAARQARRNRLDPDTVYDLALWVFLGGLIGARLFYVVQYWGVRVHSLADVVKIWEGGIVLYGSLIGAAAGFVFYRALRPFPVLPMLDALAPAMALGVAIGRVGCFLNGCCYGDRCGYPWAVQFPPDSPPWWDQVRSGELPVASGLLDAVRRGVATEGIPWSLPVHPTQIYSVIGCILITLLLLAYNPLRRRDGSVMALLLVTYPVHRFLVEWLRGDEGAFLAGLTISQNFSIALLAVGLAFWGYLASRPAALHAETVPKPAGPVSPTRTEAVA